MRSKGRIASWNDDKGYGFIAPDNGGAHVFIHIKALRNRNRRPVVNDVVSYAIKKDDQGRSRAVSAAFVGDKSAQKSRYSPIVPALFVALIFFGGVGASVIFTKLPRAILIAYLALSAITFVIYTIDKWSAQTGRWRTSENTLHLLALVGGWPGALIAQSTLRHKTKKTSFLIMFWLTVFLNCAALIWIHMEEGRLALEQLTKLLN